MTKQFKIAITGTESSGKTILSEQLANHYNSVLVTEFARDFLAKKDNKYNYEDILFMAKKQIEAEQKAVDSGAQIIICDTDTINLKIWLEYYNYEVPEFIINHISSKPYYHSLLLYPNTAWINDGLRKNENERLELYTQFKKNLSNYNYSFSIIDQLNNSRLSQAITALDKIIF